MSHTPFPPLRGLLPALALALCAACVSELKSLPCTTDADCSRTQQCVDLVCVDVGTARDAGTGGGSGGGAGAGGGVGAGGGSAGGGSATGDAGANDGGAGGGSANDAGLRAPSQVLSAAGHMAGGALALDVQLGESIATTTMAGGGLQVTTSVSLRHGP